MSLTVGLPTAMGAELVLHGKISEKGVIRPIYKDIYDPVLKMLEKFDIKLIEVEEELWLSRLPKRNIILVHTFLSINILFSED